MRMVNDRVHKYFLNWLRLSATEPQPSPVQSLQQLKIITVEDISQDNDWKKAPRVVQSNMEQVRINRQRYSSGENKRMCSDCKISTHYRIRR